MGKDITQSIYSTSRGAMSNINNYLGCILGLAAGDSMGAPFEGSQLIDSEELDALFAEPPLLRYTDDTEMAIAVCQTLIRHGHTGQAELSMHFAHSFVENFTPWRGYGRGASAIMGMLKNGAGWEQVGRAVFPEGSFGNGAAMRAAPIGLYYHNRPKRIREVARASSLVTHVHPLGLEGARLVALATSWALTGKDTEETLALLLAEAQEPEYTEKLRLIKDMLASPPSPARAARELGCSVAAHESVPAAIAAFLFHGGEAGEAIRYAIQMGGDTDTIASMAGAMSGAMGGAGTLPGQVLEKLEDRNMLEELARGIYNNMDL